MARARADRDEHGAPQIHVRDLGSFFIGGRHATLAGQPRREVRYAAAAPPLFVDPNGTFVTGQIYAQYVRLSAPISPYPILFLNGGTSTGAMWETTPDGRPGWQLMFLRRGYDTFLTDACGKGRASYAPFPTILTTEPVFRPNEQTWRLLRIGTDYDADPRQRQAFTNTQFPVDCFDDYSKQIVPRFAGQDEAELTAYRELIERIGPVIVVAQSSGGYLATLLAAELPELIVAVVTAELTAVPSPPTNATQQRATCPQLIIWGDNWKRSSPWDGIRAAVDAYVSELQANRVDATLVDLPELGIAGNSHQLMADRNSATIFELVADWIEQRLTAQKD